jgi:hypothetical protein
MEFKSSQGAKPGIGGRRSRQAGGGVAEEDVAGGQGDRMAGGDLETVEKLIIDF